MKVRSEKLGARTESKEPLSFASLSGEFDG